MKALYADAARVARSRISVVLLGETGVGKEVMARAIHAHSTRAAGPFLGVNCAALTESLLESELFGTERGAFTGAVTRPGLFEAAKGGTVFLDEIGDLPLGTQAKLLRVLEERVVTRLGSTRPCPIDVRFLAATHRDLEADCRQGRMRSDLYFRLSGVVLVIPPLRERTDEVEPLATQFLKLACRDLERSWSPAISPRTLALLSRHPWPGNVRELRNVMERAAVMCTELEILPEHLPASFSTKVAATSPSVADEPLPMAGVSRQNLQTEMKALERRKILDALERCHGNQSDAAKQLGMPRRTLVTRLSEFGFTRKRIPSDSK
jgi:DNA-binding NtrC family response regulator